MTAELVRGQNLPLHHLRLEIRVAADTPLTLCAALTDETGRALTEGGALAHPGAPALPGLEGPLEGAGGLRLDVDLDALSPQAHRLGVLLALPPGGPAGLGAIPAPRLSLTDRDSGTPLAHYTLTGLGPETAVTAVELYRRNGGWKARAVGQGHRTGLPGLLAEHGFPEPDRLATTIAAPPAAAPRAPTVPPPAPGPSPSAPAAPPSGIDYTHPRRRPHIPAPAAPAPAPESAFRPPVAGDAEGWTPDERLYNQVWGMFEDLARAVAAYRGALQFADDRREQELDTLLADPLARTGRGAEEGRATAFARHAELSARARAVLDRDLDQLQAESEVVEPALPAAYASWDSPAWQYPAGRLPQPPAQAPMAVRLGALHLPERPGLRIPLLTRLPLERGLWIDSGGREGGAHSVDETRRLAADLALDHLVRLLAVYPAGELVIDLLDPAGSAATTLAPLTAAGLPVTIAPAGAAGVRASLGRLAERVDLVQMALRGGAEDALPPGMDLARHLLVVQDFPYGFDDRAVHQLRYLADEGPAAGVHLLLVADRADAHGLGPLLDPLWRGLLRLAPSPEGYLADPWVGHTWTLTPSFAPRAHLTRLLEQLARAPRAEGPYVD